MAPVKTADEGRRIAASGALLLVAFAVTKAAGYLQKVIIAHRFGTSGDMDVYALSFTVPDLLLFLVIGGAVSSAFVPVTSARLATGDEEGARRVVNGVMTAAFLILVSAVLVLELVAPVVVHQLAGLRPPREQDLALTLTRVLLLQALFLGLGGFAVGVMNTYRKFVPLSLAPLFYDLAIIAAALLLTRVKVNGEALGVVGLAIGVAAGGLLHFLVQVPSLLRIGWRPIVVSAIRDPGVRRVARLTIPISLGLIAVQANISIDRYLASGLPSGRVAALDFANEIAQLPNLTFTTALTLVMFPYFARDAAVGNLDQLRRRAALAVRLNMFVLLPSAIVLVVLGPEVVALLLQRGAFNAESTSLVADILALFAVGIAAQASIFLVVRVYYSLQRVITPMLVAFASVAVNLSATAIFLHPLGARGLALATSLASICNFTLLVVFLRPLIGGFDGRRLAISLAQVVAGSVVLGAVSWLLYHVLSGPGPVRLDVRHYAALAVSLGGGGVVFIATQFALRSEEVGVALQVFLRRGQAAEAVA
jgi:putative peptidoglycan lipid II flippase